MLVAAALDIFIKEKNNTLYLLWISPLSFYYAKDVYSVKLSGEVPHETFSAASRIFQPPAYYILHKFLTPLLIRMHTPPPFMRDFSVLSNVNSYFYVDSIATMLITSLDNGITA